MVEHIIHIENKCILVYYVFDLNRKHQTDFSCFYTIIFLRKHGFGYPSAFERFNICGIIKCPIIFIIYICGRKSKVFELSIT